MNKNNSLKELSSLVLSFGRFMPAVIAGVVISAPLAAVAGTNNYESFPGSAISDNSCTNVNIPVADDFVISDLNVGVNLTHTYRGDLRIKLLAPDGTDATLYDRYGSGADNLDISFDDAHVSSVSNVGMLGHDVSSPFYDNEHRSDDGLSVFNSLSPAGNWVLQVCDEAGGDTGTVHRVLLEFGDGDDGDVTASGCGPVVTSIMPSGSLADAGNADRASVIAFDYDWRGDASDTPDPIEVAAATEVGTVWGKSYDPDNKQLYVSAFLRRHAALSPDGLGAIYKVDVSNISTDSSVGTPSLWMDLNSLTHLGAGATLFPSETAANRGLGAPFTPSHDIWAFSRVGKQGLGGLDLSDDYRTMYAMDLTNRQLLVVDIASKTVTARHPVSNSECANAADVRPFGVNYLDGDVYVGVTCSDETNQSGNGAATAHVMKLVGNSFSNVVTGSLKGYYWSHYWEDDPGVGGCSASNRNAYVPIVTNMELDQNGNMLVGVTGVNAWRYASQNYAPISSCSSTLGDSSTRGFVLHATPNGSTWEVASSEETENSNYTHRYKNGQYAHWGSGASHTYMGGMAVTECTGEEVAIVNLMDPLNHESAGTRYMRTSDAQHETASSVGDVARSTSDASTLEHYRGYDVTWEKSSGMGDIEFLSNLDVTVDTGSISGKVYSDSNGNDSYDSATESGVGSITVSLLSDVDGSGVETTSTAADGSYGFTGLDAGIDYRVVVDMADADLPVGSVIGTTNPLTGVSVSAGLATANQNFGFDISGSPGSCSGAIESVNWDITMAGLLAGGTVTINGIDISVTTVNRADPFTADGELPSGVHLNRDFDTTTSSITYHFSQPITRFETTFGAQHDQEIITFSHPASYVVNELNTTYGLQPPIMSQATLENDGLELRSNLTDQHPGTTSQAFGSKSTVTWDFPTPTRTLTITNTGSGQGGPVTVTSGTVSTTNYNGTIVGGAFKLTTCPDRLDYGDAPVNGTAPDGGSTNAYGEASHIIISGLFLGGGDPDADSANQPSADAGDAGTGGDDGDGTDDEDGISVFPTLTAGDTSYILPKANITAVGSGVLHAWIDFNGDGSFESIEHASTTVTAGTIGADLSWAGQSTMSAGTTFGRFRLTTDTLTSGDAATAASDGEVEDYAVTVVDDSDAAGVITGTVYSDANGNDNYDSGSELGLGAVTVTLLNDADGSALLTTDTDANGFYSFDGLDVAQTFRLVVDTNDTNLPATLAIGTTNPLEGVAVTAGNTTADQNFGFDTSSGGTPVCWAIDDDTANIYRFLPDTNNPRPPVLIPTARANSGEGLTWRRSTNELYMWDSDTTYVMDATTGDDVRTFTADLSPGSHVEGSAFYIDPITKQEELWLIVLDYDGSDRSDRYLIRIDPYTGAGITSVGPLTGGYVDPSVDYGKDTGGLAIDPNTKQFWVTNDGSDRGVYPLNEVTGVVGSGVLFNPPEVDGEALEFADNGLFYTESDEGPSNDRYIWQVNGASGTMIRAAGPFPGDGDIEGVACNSGASVVIPDSCSLVVVTTNDSDNAENNSGSLRDAIECANETAGPNTITFNMPTSESGYSAGSGVWTISPASQLPTVTDAGTTIDASTQSGAACGNPWAASSGRTLTVQLDGTTASSAAYTRGIEIQGDNFGLRGLSVTNFLPGVGVYTQSGADSSRFTCNHIGVAADGMTTGSNSNGMDLRGTNTQLGDVGVGDGNVISGNNLDGGLGVAFNNANTSYVYNNFFGIGLDGETAVANRTALWNIQSANMQIGGAATGQRNLFSGNSSTSITFRGPGTDDSYVQGNYIGTNKTGLVAVGNQDGVGFGDFSTDITIGGSAEGEGNIISGNTGHAIGSGSDVGEDAHDNIIIGNLIGLGKDGVNSLPNRDGITLYEVNNFVIQENIISNNTRWGIMLQNGADDVVISRNSIFNNGSMGVDLQSHDSSFATSVGVTPNDPNDIDDGANSLINFPEMNLISHSGTTVNYDFDLDVAAGVYRVEFFDNPSGLDSSGHGEGEVYLGSIDITHTGSGSENFTGFFVATQVPFSDNTVVTTVTSGSGEGETSEFSGILIESCSLVVITTADSDSADNNSGSLRDAIECANETEGLDTISFNIPTTESGYTNLDGVPGNADDYWSIQPASRLPFITDPLVIAGDTQPGYADKPIIELDGSVAGSVEGFFLDTGSDGSTIRALIVNRFELSGVELRDSSNNTVAGSYIGTDSSGLLAYGNDDHGIEIADGSSNNTIGGVNALDGNIISGNQDSGIRIDGSGSNTIQGNLIGLGRDGQTAMGNANHGLYISAAPGNQVGGNSEAARNVIADSGYNGIEVFEATANVIEGNYIGTDSTGTQDRGNHIYGIKLTNADGNNIGGSGAGNLISGNEHDGIMIQGSDGNTVQSNSIGTDVSGTLSLGNSGVGITVRDGESNQIGGLTAGLGNVISANGDQGIWVRDNTSRLNQIQGNVIGASAVGAALGNGAHGVEILSAMDTEVSQNEIVHNSSYGVFLDYGAVTNQVIQNTISDNRYAGIANGAESNNTFSQNSISSNGALGIDLGLDGVTGNSNSDSWLNYPEISESSSISTNGTMIVAYDFDLDVPANTDGYRVEFFSNSEVDPSLHGEGENYLGYIDLVHQGAGSENFKGSFNANQVVPENANVALTLTEKLGVTILGSTSEFSRIRNGGLSVCTDLLADPDASMVDVVIDENSPAITYLEALDADGNPVTYAISGGADGNRFVIDPVAPDALFDCVTIRFISNNVVDNRRLSVAANSVVRAGQQPDPGNYEVPVDSGRDNVYDLEITVTDINGNTVTKPLSVVVRNVNEKPFITSAGMTEFLERQDVSAVVIDLQSYDPDADDAEGSGLTYSISGGADGHFFNVDTQSGELRFESSPDYGSPLDSNSDNSYELIVRVTDDQGYAGSQNLLVEVTDDPDKNDVRVSIKALLQGPYDWSSGLMNDDLRSSGVLSVSQPYAAEPFNYQGAEALDLDKVELTGDEAIVDWVLVELRSSDDPLQVVATQAGIVRRNGDVADVSLTGAGVSFAGVAAGQYYVSLRHRNHLGVMTAEPLSLSMTTELVDFSHAATSVYGEHARLVSNDVALLWSGDINQDDRLILNGQGSDLNVMLSTVLVAPGNEGFNSSYQVIGYNAADLNMDGKVVFMGPANDADSLLGNTLSHPENVSFSGNFIVVGGM